MIIPDELAQEIVNITHALTRQNVNIMNREAVIIGTAQKHRYKTFHKGAQDVIESGEPVEIQPDEVQRYPGALPGLNLPIVLEGQIIGVVGVSGAPDEVRGYARLVKKITELILERELIQREVRSRLRLKEQLVELLIWRFGPENLQRIKRIANTLTINLNATRAVVAADVGTLIDNSYAEYGESELVLERFSESVVQHLTEHQHISHDEVAVVFEKKLIILKAFKSADCDEVRRWTGTLQRSLDLMQKGKVYCGAGAVCRTTGEYQFSFMQAEFCLKQCSPERPYSTVYDHDLRSSYLLHKVTSSPENIILDPLLESFRQAFSKKLEYVKTLRVLLENNLEIKKTAYALGIHRNTLLYRLESIKEASGLDPVKRLDDAIMARILVSIPDVV